ncbi:MAG: hypothetical protein K0Q77_2583 [Anaerosporomusa subterranea]|nr:hypothetical protein [Anaerosporomusa subterranea]
MLEKERANKLIIAGVAVTVLAAGGYGTYQYMNPKQAPTASHWRPISNCRRQGDTRCKSQAVGRCSNRQSRKESPDKEHSHNGQGYRQ